MNFLGHLALTYPHRELTMGNLLGDFVRRSQMTQLPPAIQNGIALHHDIDRITDSHPAVRDMTDLMRADHARYAPVVVDILMDHILARQWRVFVPEISYPDFTRWVYALIREHLDALDSQLALRLRHMATHRWIDDYHTTGKLRDVLRRMDNRASFPSHFILAIDGIERYNQEFSDGFRVFYADIRQQLVPLLREHSIAS
jgi:acyl carrier protein phosphodiesterase